MLDKLKDLCLLDGISGDEGAVREYIIDKIGDKAEIRVDNLGNLIAFCKGKIRLKQDNGVCSYGRGWHDSHLCEF